MCSHFFTYTQCQINYCYTCGLLSADAVQGELPEGQERVPWGDTRVAQLAGLDILHDTYELHSLYRRVRQGELPVRAREGALGYDSAHRLYPTWTIYPVGAVIGRLHNGKPSRQFSILHYPFSITANR